MISEVYGLRLLARPSTQRSVVLVLLGVLVLFRIVQIFILAQDDRWALDFSYYWTAASRLLDGQPIYSAQQLNGVYIPEGQDGFLYPPPFAVLVIPFAVLFPTDYGAAGWLWLAIGLALLVVSVLAIVRAEGLGDRFRLFPGHGGALLVAAAFVLPPVIGELTVGNVHLEIVALLTMAWLGLRRGDGRGDAMAGAGIAAAAMLKVFPGLLFLWLLLTGRWRALAWGVAAMVAIGLVTLPFTGIEAWLQYPRVIANMGPILDIHDSVSPTLWLEPLTGFALARWIVLGAGLMLVLLTARWKSMAIGFSIAVTVSVLVAPAVFHHYLTVLILPMLLALASGVSMPVLGLAYFLLWGGQQPALGDWSWVLSRVPQTLGWAILLIALLRHREQAAAASPASATATT